MKTVFIIVKLLFVVLIAVLIIKFLLVFNPFSPGKTAEDKKEHKLEWHTPGDNENTLEMSSTGSDDLNGTSDENKDTIGIWDSEKKSDSLNEDTEENGSIKERQEYFLTYDEIVSIKNMNFRDKLFGLSMLKKIDKLGLENMLKIANGGITNEEWTSISNMLEQYLNDKDFERLKEIIIKNKKLYDEGKLANR